MLNIKSQPRVFEYLKTADEALSTADVAEGTGLTVTQAGNALTNLKKKGAIVLVETGARGAALWEHNPNVDNLSDLKGRRPALTGKSKGKGKSKGLVKVKRGQQNAAQARFDAAMVAMLDAQKELTEAYDALQPYIMSEQDIKTRDIVTQAAKLLSGNT